ncbi:MAG: hypothetical protein GY717_21355 [Rhodobacteraceae bacterium]|nr:hypothetical protein [Paracoccaceae bacterium]
MGPDEIEALFSRTDGSYFFARWGRPVAPVVFGVDEATLQVVKGAAEALATLAGHQMAETDPELGANLMLFFFRDWVELTQVPDLDRLVPDLGALVARLAARGANQHRFFRFDDSGAIQAAFVFLRMDEALSKLPAEELALGQMVQVMLAWSDRAFATRSPLALAGGHTVLRPDIADLIRAAYDPVMPVAAQDASHALRLAARMERRAGYGDEGRGR